MLHRALWSGLVVGFLLAGLRAQELPPLDGTIEVTTTSVRCTSLLQKPRAVSAAEWLPVLVLLPGRSVDLERTQALMRSVGSDAARAGFLVVAPVCGGGQAKLDSSKGEQAIEGESAELARALPKLLAETRKDYHVAQGGMHVVVCGDFAEIAELLVRHRHEFQSFTALGDVKDADVAALRKLPSRRVHVLPEGDAAARQRHFAALRAEREFPGAAADVARTLDDFHDAAAKGDEARYFAILPDDAVFLGTDLSERWTGAQFRAYAMPYFQRAEAWTYLPLQRHITMEPGDTVAWFDEVLANSGYGECRGTGVLVKRGAQWVLRQYDLTIPIPNDLAGGVTQRIRAFADGKAPAVTTIVLVRHAEKVDASTDAALSDAGRTRAEALGKALRDLPITAAYSSEFQRTAATIAPLCAQRSLQATVLPAADAKALARKLQREHLGQTVLVCGHSNTVPALCKALGVVGEVKVADDEFDRLFVITLGPDGASVLPLRY